MLTQCGSCRLRNANTASDGYFLFSIFVTKLPDDRGLNVGPVIILMRRPIIVLALMNGMGRTRFTCSKNIRDDSEVRLNLGL